MFIEVAHVIQWEKYMLCKHADLSLNPEYPCNNFILHTGKGEDDIRQNTSFVVHQYIKNNKLNFQQETLSQILEYGRGK